MKKNFARVMCLAMLLASLATVLGGCSKDPVTKTDVTGNASQVVSVPESVMVTVDEDDPFTIVSDANGKEIVILIPGDNSEVVMQVAADTTVEQFLAVVTAKEGYLLQLRDASGNAVSDGEMIIADNMIFEVIKDGEETAEISYTISVVSKAVIEQTVQKQEEIDKIVSNIIAKDPSNVSSKGDPSAAEPVPGPVESSSTVSSAPQEEDITLSSIWMSRYTTNDAVGKIWQAVFKDIKTRYNINTTVTNLDGNNATDIVVKDVMAGKTSADVYEVSAYICRSIARKGALVSVYDSKTLARDKFDNAGTESMRFGSKVYGVAIDANATKPMGILYNKDLVKKYAPSYNIEKLFNEDKWDFETFKTIAQSCTQDTNGDGKADVFGLTSNTNVIGMALTANAGGTATMQNGKVIAAMCSDAGVASLEWMKELFNGGTWKYFANIKDSVTFFSDGNAAMFASWMSYYTDIIPRADFEIGFVLMPMGPDMDSYITGQYDARYFVVPKTNESRLDVVGNWLNGTASASDRLINEELKNMARNGLDQTSRDIYKWSVINASPEYSSGLFSTAISSQVDSSVTSKSKSPAKVMNSIKSQAQKELDDFFAPLY